MAFPGLSTIDRVRREVERNALRARNGIRMATGIQRTDVGLSPKDVVWSNGRTELWHYRSEQVSLPSAAADHLQPVQQELHPRPAAGQ